MAPMVEAASEDVVAATLEEEVTMVGEVVVTSSTSPGTSSLRPAVWQDYHPVFKCYKRFDPNYMGEEKSANSTNSYGVDSNWYADSGATDHVTGELDKLVTRDTYNGNDQIYTANGTGMCIQHVGQSIIHTPHRDLIIHNVLHVSQASKNLTSVHRIASDNNVFFELHPNVFFYQGLGVEENTALRQG
jgi:hypothetical protein